MDTLIKLEVKDSHSQVSFEPEVSQESFVHLFNNALNTVPGMFLNLLATIPLLRPVCDVEKEHNIYVFQEGEKGEYENNLYKYRKHLYDVMTAVFSELLTTAFADIEYIELCKKYHQDFCVTHTEEETEDHKKNVEEVTAFVRNNFDKILEEISKYEEKEETMGS